MPEQTEKSTTLTETPAAEEASFEDKILDTIVASDGTPPKDESSPANGEALPLGYSDDPEPEKKEETGSEQKTPDAQVPEDKAGDQTGKETQPKEGEAAEATGEEAEQAELKKQQQQTEEELLGLEHTEPETDPVWKGRSAEKDRYITQISEQHRREISARDELLQSLGRKVVNTNTGYQMIVADDAKDFSVEDADLSRMFNELSKDEQDKFGETDARVAFAIVAEKMSKKFASEVPPVTATPNDAILSEYDCNEIYNDFLGEKRADGKTPMFPDTEKPEIQNAFNSVLSSNDPVMSGLREVAAGNKFAYRALLELGWLRVFRAKQASRALAGATKRQEQQTAEENKKGVAVTGSGGETNAQTKRGSSGKSESDALLDFVMGSDKDSSPNHPNLQ